MMRTGILHIGDELLTGEIDPYPREIIQMIRQKGAGLDLLEVVGDREEDIVRCLEHAQAFGIDILVITGGLGPTLDDLTREAVARFLGTDLVVDPEAAIELERVLTAWHGRSVAMSEITLRMARVPRGHKALMNLTGAACGVEARKEGMTMFLLPGFPNEMVPMFKAHVLPRIIGSGVVEAETRAYLGESLLEPLFQEVAASHNVRIACLPSVRWREEGNRIIFKGEKEEAEAALAHFMKLLEHCNRL